MSRAPVTQRLPRFAEDAAEVERLLHPKTPTCAVSREAIDALIEADAERAQSESEALLAAAKAAEGEKQ